MVQVSLFASSVRPQLYEAFFKSLEGTSVEYEVVFAGNNQPENCGYIDKCKNLNNFQYIPTSNIKPSQCYEIARRYCQGETVVWVADDAEFPNDVIGKAYRHWKEQNNEKLILSIQTKESGYGLREGALFNMNNHTFFGFKKDTPLMAPLALMSRAYLEKLGGIDRRYVCGQYENDVVMRAYVDGGKVEIFGDKDCFIDIDHLGKSIAIGESRDERAFLRRPFASGYGHDRKILEESWTKNGEVTFERNDKFEPFEDEGILEKSQSHPGQW